VFADQLGCKLEEASPWKDDYFGQFFTIVLAETDLKGMREFVAKYGDHMQPHLVDAIQGTMTDVQITDALMARQGPETIEGKKAGPFQWITFTYQFNLTGQPAASVPAGFTKDGLPIGLQVVGRQRDDATVLRAAAAYEAAAPWKDKWPPMLAQMGL
jgi:aspartyl-tRNA(Asn)/glutamyl-tRNA(Gln) amidotransferase subunit A